MLDLITLAQEIENRYRRYLGTTFYFRDPLLRQSFQQALASGHLRRGPYIEATPAFRPGPTLRDLFAALIGHPDDLFIKALQGDRPLYAHQDQAIRAAVRGEHVVVATGTGSGKTEAFLYPILLHLYQEFRADKLQAGVRALILYPMNALANDQRERLGDICHALQELRSPFQFTFGQYTGETPEDERDMQRHALDHIARCLPGELVLRSKMRDTPPHILLTNYSMLEYLLLRPDDSPLFDNGRSSPWTFLVLDEAHQYRGSRGIEMAMLLRRLKRRLREGGRTEPLRCIATSATLAGGEEDKPQVARFASDLFGEEFRNENVILAEFHALPDPAPRKLPPQTYSLLREVPRRGTTAAGHLLTPLVTSLGLPVLQDEEPEKTVARLLQQDARVTRLHRLIRGKPVEIPVVADQVFDDLPSAQRIQALSQLVELLIQATDPATGSPLLSARYHLFLRSLEGAFVSYWPTKRVFLDRKAQHQEGAAFEVALCRECGQHYFVGHKRTGGRLEEPVRDPSHPDFGATFFRPLDNGEGVGEQDDQPNKASLFQLCIQCGRISQVAPTCRHGHTIRIIKEDPPRDEDRADQLSRCGACGYSAAGRDPVREVVHGTDGPNAVIATTLYQYLPEARKKVLAFADGRQEAAFFAWYLEDSYRSILRRNLIRKVVQRLSPHATEGLSLQELAIDLYSLFREERVFPPATGELQLRREAWLSLYREFLADEPRISLEGVGLVRWDIKWPPWLRPPGALMTPPWTLTEVEARDLIIVLLDSLRADKAVEIRTQEGIRLNWSDLGLQGSQMRVRIGGHQGVRAWDGSTTRRTRLLAKIFRRLTPNAGDEEALQQALTLLREVWEAIRHADERAPSSEDRLLLSVDDARRFNPDWWRLRPIELGDTVFRCDTCGRLRPVSVRNSCPRGGCPGNLERVRVRDLEPNHYRTLYSEQLPGSLRVEEHTAQLDKEKAREFQREFRNGNIHVLSSSTTFELGVDLGDLDTIFLRNVPPESFNYVQRVGRAGRRAGHPGFAITYCRRAPHDLYHFAEPQRILQGKVRPPALSLRNEKIATRHITATVLSYFFRAHRDRFSSVATFLSNLEHPSAVQDLRKFIDEERGQLEETLRSIVPHEDSDIYGLSDQSWIARVAGEDSRLRLAELEISSDYRTVRLLQNAAAEKGDYDTAKWARDRATTIARENVLEFLSRKAVIPKYGFPVDVVELDPHRTERNQQASDVLLQRDLGIAISEFAPTSQLVANKKVWTSHGLKKVPEREWPRKYYKRCPQHNVFLAWKPGEPEPLAPCGDSPATFQYVVPVFGFMTNREKPKEPTSRPSKIFTTRPYFSRPASPDRGDIAMRATSGLPLLTIKKASPGWMVVLCEGRRGGGFYICAQCGSGFRNLPKRLALHKNALDQDCRGKLERVSLGHEFVTDVLQLQFHAGPIGRVDTVWFAFALAYAVVEGAAEILEVPSTDLTATVGYLTLQSVFPPIVLYDSVPGGAGLVALLEEEHILRACLEAARKRVRGDCGCDEETSCYGCLRSYRNQFAHQHLQRGPVKRYLDQLFSLWSS